MVLRVMCLDRCLVANLGNRDRDEALHGGTDCLVSPIASNYRFDRAANDISVGPMGEIVDGW